MKKTIITGYDLKKLSQKEIIEIANDTDRDLAARCGAVRRILWENELDKLIKTTTNRTLIIKILEDSIFHNQAIIEDFAFNHYDWRVRYAAFRKLTGCFIELDDLQYDSFIIRDDLADIASSDEDVKRRIVACLLLDDEEVLNRIAHHDRHIDVRAAAASRINDDETLAGMVKDEFFYGASKMASYKIKSHDRIVELVKKFRDHRLISILTRNFSQDELIELYSPHSYQASGIISNIRNQKLLIEEVYKSDDGALSFNGFVNIHNQKTLHKILTDRGVRSRDETYDRCISFPSYYVEFFEFLHVGVNLIIDDELLRDLAFNYREPKMVAENTFSPELLADIALNFPIDVNRADFTGITDEEKLFALALNHCERNTRHYAVNRIFDRQKLEAILEKESDESIRKTARDNLNLDEISLQSDNPFVVAEAIKYVDDDYELLDIYYTYRNLNIEQAAVEAISDENILKNIACNSFLGISCITINCIKDQRILGDIALEAPFEITRVYAITKIDDDEVLKDIFNRSDSYSCQINALSRIGDEEFLDEIRTSHPDEYLRIVAEESLEECR